MAEPLQSATFAAEIRAKPILGARNAPREASYMTPEEDFGQAIDQETPRVSGTRWSTASRAESLSDLIDLHGRKKSSLRIVVDDALEGEIVLVAGAIATARYGNLGGERALHAMLHAELGHLRTIPLFGPHSGMARGVAEDNRLTPIQGTPAHFPVSRMRPILPSESDTTRDLADDLVGFRDGAQDVRNTSTDAEPPDDTTRFFTVEREVVEAAESALSTLTSRRTLKFATFGLYVYGKHDRRGLHVGGRRVDLHDLEPQLTALRASPRTASFELRVAPLVLFGSTGRSSGYTVVTAAPSFEAAEGARGVSTSFSRLFHSALRERGVG